MSKIEITSSQGNTPKSGKRCFWVYVNGQMLRRKDGVGRMFFSEEAARKAGERACRA